MYLYETSVISLRGQLVKIIRGIPIAFACNLLTPKAILTLN